LTDMDGVLSPLVEPLQNYIYISRVPKTLQVHTTLSASFDTAMI